MWESIPTAQAQTMPPFQELDATHRGWSLRNKTPFLTMRLRTDGRGGIILGVGFQHGDSPDFDGNNAGGCPLFGEIEAFPNQLSVSLWIPCGVVAARGLVQLDNYDFTGVVLLLIATQERTVIGTSEAYSSVVASKPVRVAKTASEIEKSGERLL